MFERKTPSDLRQSLMEQRGWEQVKALAEARDTQGFKTAVIWEDAPQFEIGHRLGTAFVSWQVWLKRHPELEVNWYSMYWGVAKWGIPLIPTKNEEGSAKFLAYVDKTLGSGKKRGDYPLRKGFRKDMTVEERRAYLFDAFGHATGKALLTTYGSPIGLTDRKWLTRWVDGKWTDQERIIKEVADVKLESGRRIGLKKAEDIYVVLFGD